MWSFDSVSKVFLLSFLGSGFTFHRFLGNQTKIENSRERDLLGGDVSGTRLEEEIEVGGVLSQATKNKIYTPKIICSSASKDRSHGEYLT